jgi:hypothetical protein
MKTKLMIFIITIFLYSCKDKKEPLKEYTYVVHHAAGIDTVKAVDVYADRLYVKFYQDKLFGIESGKFNSPYSFKIINK